MSQEYADAYTHLGELPKRLWEILKKAPKYILLALVYFAIGEALASVINSAILGTATILVPKYGLVHFGYIIGWILGIAVWGYAFVWVGKKVWKRYKSKK